MRAGMTIRVCKLVVGVLWAGVLVIFGALLWPVHVPMAICLIAGGQCVAMWWIADTLWPHALPAVTGFFKLTAAMVFLSHLALATYMLWPS